MKFSLDSNCLSDYGDIKSDFVELEYTHNCPITPYSKFVLELFPDVYGKTIVDFGTGSGIFAIVASMLGANKIYAIDICSDNLRIAQQNATDLNRINISFYKQFNNEIQNIDFIISNPASFPDIINSSFCSSGVLGLDMIFELITNAKRVLCSKGELFFLHSSLSPFSLIHEDLRRNNFDFTVTKKKIPFRDFYAPILKWSIEMKCTYDEIYFIEENGKYFEELFFIRATLK